MKKVVPCALHRQKEEAYVGLPVTASRHIFRRAVHQHHALWRCCCQARSRIQQRLDVGLIAPLKPSDEPVPIWLCGTSWCPYETSADHGEFEPRKRYKEIESGRLSEAHSTDEV